MTTYVFEVEIEQDDDGRWGAEIPLLPGCNAWGYTREQALAALRDTAQAFVEVMLEDGDTLPTEAQDRVVQSSGSTPSVADLVTVTL